MRIEEYIPELAPAVRFAQGAPKWFTPDEWKVIGATVLGAAGLIVVATAIHRARAPVREGDRTCDIAIYREVLGRHATPVTKSDRAWLYLPYVRAYGKHFGVDPTFLAGLIHTESGWNPNAGSSAGAIGLTQFMPSTAKSIFRSLVEEGQWPFPAVRQNNDPQANDRLADVAQWLDRTNPAQSVWLSARFMRGLLSKYPPDLALAAYNGGAAVIGVPRDQWPQETQAYVPGVLRRQGWYQELEAACR